MATWRGRSWYVCSIDTPTARIPATGRGRCLPAPPARYRGPVAAPLALPLLPHRGCRGRAAAPIVLPTSTSCRVSPRCCAPGFWRLPIDRVTNRTASASTSASTTTTTPVATASTTNAVLIMHLPARGPLRAYIRDIRPREPVADECRSMPQARTRASACSLPRRREILHGRCRRRTSRSLREPNPVASTWSNCSEARQRRTPLPAALT